MFNSVLRHLKPLKPLQPLKPPYPLKPPQLLNTPQVPQAHQAPSTHSCLSSPSSHLKPPRNLGPRNWVTVVTPWRRAWTDVASYRVACMQQKVWHLKNWYSCICAIHIDSIMVLSLLRLAYSQARHQGVTTVTQLRGPRSQGGLEGPVKELEGGSGR